MYQSLIRPILFQLAPEKAHELTVELGKIANFKVVQHLLRTFFDFNDPRLEQEVFGLKFSSPVGMAAGLDKDCTAVPLMSSFGFSFLELGGITAKAQPGNPKPRVFRIPEHQAIVNRMGLPSIGADLASQNLLHGLSSSIKTPLIAVNIAKSHAASVEETIPDYLETFAKFYDLCQFFVINVSCPNQANYQQLQEKDRLQTILKGFKEANKLNKPVLVKLSPDLTEQHLEDALNCCLENSIAGLICGNTSTSRPISGGNFEQQGGLSGGPIFPTMLDNVRRTASKLAGKLPIIACGGISNADQVIEVMKAGASLVQVYTGMVYHGPGLIKKIKKDLLAYLEREGLKSLGEIKAQF